MKDSFEDEPMLRSSEAVQSRSSHPQPFPWLIAIIAISLSFNFYTLYRLLNWSGSSSLDNACASHIEQYGELDNVYLEDLHSLGNGSVSSTR